MASKVCGVLERAFEPLVMLARDVSISFDAGMFCNASIVAEVGLLSPSMALGLGRLVGRLDGGYFGVSLPISLAIDVAVPSLVGLLSGDLFSRSNDNGRDNLSGDLSGDLPALPILLPKSLTCPVPF